MRFINFFNSLKLGVKLNITAMLVFGLLLVGVILTTSSNLAALILQAGRQNVTWDAQAIQTRVSEIEQETLNNASSIINTPGLLESLTAGDIQPVTAELLIQASRFDFDDLDVVDAAGKRQFDVTATGEEGEDNIIKLALLGFEATGMVIEESDEGSSISFAAAVPIKNKNGETIGALFASRIIDDEIVTRINIFSTQGINLNFIVDGNIVLSDFKSPGDLNYFSPYLLNIDSVTRALNGQTVVASDLIADAAGNPIALGHIPLTVGGETWGVICILVKMSELAAFQRQLVFSQLLTFSLITLLALAALAFFTSRSVVTPLRQLQLAAERLASGDYTLPAINSGGDEVGQLANSFNSMASQLGSLIGSLEQRVAERTNVLSKQALQLQASANVSRAVSSILNSGELIQQAVDLVHDHFDLYYVGLFLLDDSHRFAILGADTKKADHKMRADAHQIEIDSSTLVGRSIIRKEAEFARGRQFDDNLMLPNTRSELALPLIAQGQVIGAMTLQSEHESAFSAEDISILQSMVDQLANGIEKARLYGQIQQRTIELDRAKTAADAAKEEAEQARMVAEEANQSLAAQIWQTTGQTALNEKMRGEQDIATLAHNVIQQLCKYLEIHSGAVYIVEGKVLRLTGTYAYQRRSFAQEYKLGEDLVGEAAVGKEIISNELPEDYITSDLAQGKIIPRFRLIVPVIYNQEVSGVVALESMNGFTPAQKRFVEQAIESVAIAFMTAQARTRVNELLSQTRQQTEELQAQEEELRAANEELEAQAENLRTSRNRPNANLGR